jgi:beta-lactam-binding protein with PASTA domain
LPGHLVIAKLLKISLVSIFLIAIAGLSAFWSVTWIIRGEDAVVVPDLVGKDVVYALEILTDLGLNAKVRGYEFNPDIPKNHIIAQEPESGSERKRGRDVRVLISKGTETLIMPNLRNLRLEEADIILEENGLCRGAVARVSHTSIGDRHVIVQAPLPGLEVRKEDCVDLLVSQGSPPTWHKMPMLKNLHLDEAVRLLENRQLQVGPVETEYDPTLAYHVVLDQEPAAGYRVMGNSVVGITINQKPGSGPAILSNGLYPGRLFRYRLEEGFLNRHIRAQFLLNETTVEIYNGYVNPGKELVLFVPETAENDLMLQVDGQTIFVDFDGTLCSDFLFSGLPDMPKNDR